MVWSHPRGLRRPRFAGCNGIPRDSPPLGWTLDVHQPGAWWEKPLIPRALTVGALRHQADVGHRPRPQQLDALPPGSDINLTYFMDDQHCNVGWRNAVSREHTAWGDPQNGDVVPPRLLAERSGTGRPRVALSEPLRLPGRRQRGDDRTTAWRNAAFVDEFQAV